MEERTWAQTYPQLVRKLSGRGWAERDVVTVRRAHALGAALSGGLHRTNGRPVVAHLVGVADVLVELGCTADLIGAGLLHTALRRNRLRPVDRIQRAYARRAIQRVSGGGVLDLVERYAALGDTEVPAVVDDGWADPDLAVLQLVNVIEEIDSGVELLSPRHRAGLLAMASGGAKRAAAVGDLALAALLASSAARAAAVPVEARASSWLAETPGVPIRLSVRWTDNATWFVILAPSRAMLRAGLARRFRH